MAKTAQNYFETMLRIEAADIQEQYRHWQFRKTNMGRSTIPLRIGRHLAGVITAAFDQETVRLMLQASVSSIARERLLDFKGCSGSRFPWVRCPQCRRARKRLFLSHERQLMSRPDFEFVCVVCAGFEPDYRIRMRGPKSYSKQRAGVGSHSGGL